MYKFTVNFFDAELKRTSFILDRGKKEVVLLNKQSNFMASVSADPSDPRIIIASSANKDYLSFIRNYYFANSRWAGANKEYVSEIIKY